MDIEYLKAVRNYSVSHMSNAKWLKLLTAWRNLVGCLESSATLFFATAAIAALPSLIGLDST